MTNNIHAMAVIDKTAKIAAGVHVGAFSVIGPNVEIDEGTWIGPHVVINGPTKIGKQNKIYQFASIGEDPQDKKYKGEPTWLVIGDRNIIREHCTFNRGTVQDNSLTKIGDDNLFMAYVHIAHDCIVGNHTIFANNASLAGHVTIQDYVILGGFSGIFQGCQVGMHSFVSMGCLSDKDIPPFVKVAGSHAKPYGLNTVGMKRHQYSDETILNLRRAYKIIYRQGLTVNEAVTELMELLPQCPEVQLFIDFLAIAKRGIVR